MPKKQPANLATLESLRQVAMSLPDVEEGIACAGTSLEKRTMKVGKKAFVFLGAADVMVKLSDSVAVAQAAAKKSPGNCKVGAHGWTTIRYADENAPSHSQLAGWIVESYGLFAGGKGGNAPPKKSPVRAAKKSSRTKAAPKRSR